MLGSLIPLGVDMPHECGILFKNKVNFFKNTILIKEILKQ
jgi:hypothetical protein